MATEEPTAQSTVDYVRRLGNADAVRMVEAYAAWVSARDQKEMLQRMQVELPAAIARELQPSE